MLSFQSSGALLCDGISRREVMRIGGLGACGLSLAHLIKKQHVWAKGGRATSLIKPSAGRAKSCIVLFLMGGPPQHSTWDPKPNAPPEVRGEFKHIPTNVPGIDLCELMSTTARVMDKVCVLRAVSSGDNAHSSSGYYM